MDIKNLEYAGNLIVEYSDRIYDFDVFVTSDFKGIPKETEENIASWIEIDKLLKKDKKFADIYLLDEFHYHDLINKTKFMWHFISDKNHHKIDEIYYSNNEPFWSEYLI